MATTAAETSSASGTKSDTDSGSGRRRERRRTTLDEHVDRPSTMEPGDAPFDTTDPNERASSVSPDKAAAARAGFGTVNAVVPLPQVEQDDDGDDKGKHRTEKYKVPGPDGKLVTVTRNLETGQSEVS